LTTALDKATLPRLVAWLWLAACADAAEVRDDLGLRVSLAQPAQRIVTLAPHATELVVAAGAAARLVGVAVGADPPPVVVALPRIGGPGALDREALLALQPDLVVGWQSGNRAADLDWIAHSGVALYRSEPEALSDIAAAIRAIGVLSGRGPHADRAAAAFERDLQTPCARQPAQPAYVVVWERPAMSLGGRHWINSAMRLAGYRNVFEQLDRGVFRISAEAAHAQHGLPRLNLVRDPSNPKDARLADLLARPGPRLAEAVQLLCGRRLRVARQPPDGGMRTP
jgi:iron complex transport system substrate-binding protein